MSEVKWIKICTDIFDDEKIQLIESMPESDSIIVIWFKLLCLAGKQNNGGVFMLNNKIAYTEEMLATIFRRPLSTVRLALSTFESFGMVELVDDVVTIPNWNKHQNLDAYEKKKARDRAYHTQRRAAQRAIIDKSSECRLTSDDKSSDTITTNRLTSDDASDDKSSDVAVSELEEEREREEEKEKDYNYQLIADMYNDTCVSFPRLKTLSDARKKAIKARIKTGFTLETFKELFAKAESSSFLKGGNSRDWSANFDWMIKDSNAAKILDGNYDDRHSLNATNRQAGNSNRFVEVNGRRYEIRRDGKYYVPGGLESVDPHRGIDPELEAVLKD